MESCKIVGCGRLSYVNGYCSKHYNRLCTTGSIEDGPRARLPLSDRLWKYIEKRGPNDCWLWTGKSKVAGYGYIGLSGRSAGKALAHRVVWELTYGPIPSSSEYHGFVVMHTCDERLCCNPAHLRLGKQSDNVRDMDAKKRRVNSPQLGSKHGNAKLTEKEIQMIRSDERPIREIAKDYGMTYQNIWYIKKRQAWKHV